MYVTINVVLHVALCNCNEHRRRVMLLRSSGWLSFSARIVMGLISQRNFEQVSSGNACYYII